MAVRPVHLGIADPAPLGLAVPVAFAGLAMAEHAVVGRPVDVIDRLVGAVLVAEAGRVADVVLSRLMEALHAIDRLPVDVIGPHLLVALTAIGGDADQTGRRHLAGTAFTAVRAQEGASAVLVLAADRAGLGIDALMVLGHHDVAGAAVPLDFVDMAGAGLALAKGAGRRKAAAMARVDHHVAPRTPAGAFLGGTLILVEDLVDRFGVFLGARSAGREGQERKRRDESLHNSDPPED